MALPPRVAAIVVKKGLSLGNLGERDRAIVLALAAGAIAPERDHREAEVNAALSFWLGEQGAMLHVDHVELRRWLIDAGFMRRDGYGHAYRRDREAAERAAAILGGMRGARAIAAEIHAARTTAAAQRTARRAAFDARA